MSEDHPRTNADLAHMIVILERSAEAHDRAALLLEEQDKPDRAAWHRAAAARNRDQARRFEGALQGQHPEAD